MSLHSLSMTLFLFLLSTFFDRVSRGVVIGFLINTFIWVPALLINGESFRFVTKAIWGLFYQTSYDLTIRTMFSLEYEMQVKF